MSEFYPQPCGCENDVRAGARPHCGIHVACHREEAGSPTSPPLACWGARLAVLASRRDDPLHFSSAFEVWKSKCIGPHVAPNYSALLRVTHGKRLSWNTCLPPPRPGDSDGCRGAAQTMLQSCRSGHVASEQILRFSAHFSAVAAVCRRRSQERAEANRRSCSPIPKWPGRCGESRSPTSRAARRCTPLMPTSYSYPPPTQSFSPPPRHLP